MTLPRPFSRPAPATACVCKVFPPVSVYGGALTALPFLPSQTFCPSKRRMVKFRGIHVSIVSQFDIRKLPEFSPCTANDPFPQEGPALCSDDNSVASCYVPIYPGSQIWFEYSVDGPHPPTASYFFKMLHNGQVVTSWDCTAKHGYRGKTAYDLHCIATDHSTGGPIVQRRAFKFSPRYPQEEAAGHFDNCIEFRVHRVQCRLRLPPEWSLTNAHAFGNSHNSGLWQGRSS